MTTPEAIANTITMECLGARVRLLNRQISRVYDSVFRDLGLRATQVNLLVVLTKLGSSSPAELTHVLDMKKSTLSRNVERLRKQGLLDVHSDGPGRKQRLTVTLKGRTLLQQALPRWRKAQQHAEAILDQMTAEALRRLPTAMWGE